MYISAGLHPSWFIYILSLTFIWFVIYTYTHRSMRIWCCEVWCYHMYEPMLVDELIDFHLIQLCTWSHLPTDMPLFFFLIYAYIPIYGYICSGMLTNSFDSVCVYIYIYHCNFIILYIFKIWIFSKNWVGQEEGCFWTNFSSMELAALLRIFSSIEPINVNDYSVQLIYRNYHISLQILVCKFGL